MFKFVLAFLVWLFATGKYNDWLALLNAPATSSTSTTSTGAPASGSGNNAGTSGGGSAGSYPNLMGALGSLGGIFASGSENNGASSTSTPDDLISGFTG